MSPHDMSPDPAPAPTTATLALESLRADNGTGLRFRAEVGSGAISHFDSGPGAAGPSPVEAVLAALGSCTGMDVIGILRKKRQQVTGYEIDLVGERRAKHPRVFTRIEIVHRLRGRDLDPRAIEDALRLSESRYCSVHGMLRPTVAIASRFEIVPD